MNHLINTLKYEQTRGALKTKEVLKQLEFVIYTNAESAKINRNTELVWHLKDHTLQVKYIPREVNPHSGRVKHAEIDITVEYTDRAEGRFVSVRLEPSNSRLTKKVVKAIDTVVNYRRQLKRNESLKKIFEVIR